MGGAARWLRWFRSDSNRGKRSGLWVIGLLGAALVAVVWQQEIGRPSEGERNGLAAMEGRSGSNAKGRGGVEGEAWSAGLRKAPVHSNPASQDRGLGDPDAPEPSPSMQAKRGRLQVRAWKQPLQGVRIPLPAARVWVIPVEGGRLSETQSPLPTASLWRTIRTDGDGVGVCADLPFGTYQLRFDPDSLPSGWRPPGEYDTGWQHHAAISRIRVALGPEDPNGLVELVAQPKLRLAGRVVSDAGPLPEGTRVLVAPRGGVPMRVMQYVPVSPNGSFACEEVFPIPYALTLSIPETVSDPPILPPPRLVTLEHGSLEGVELRLGPGALQARGRVVDQTGAPQAGVPVLAYYHDGEAEDFRYSWLHRITQVTTDEHGNFAINGLRRHPFRIQADPQGARQVPDRPRRLTRTPAVVDVTSDRLAEQMDVGTIELHRAQWFEVRGRLECLGVADVHRWKNRIELDVRVDHPHPEHGQPWVAFDPGRGTFRVACETPAESMTLRAKRKGSTGTPVEARFFPEPDGIVENVILRVPVEKKP